MLHTIRNLSGSSAITGLILRATGLYFFLPSRFIRISLAELASANEIGGSIGYRLVYGVDSSVVCSRKFVDDQ